MSSELIEPAVIDWRNHQPYSDRFQDIYYSADGRSEVARVFIDPGALLDLPDPELVVGELGFGTGLNFVVLAERILEQANKRLHFISFEANPVCYDDWQTISGQQLNSPIYSALATFPPPLLRGWHRRSFADGRIRLSVFHGDAASGVADLSKQMSRPVDAWFLDGFAPDRNPDLWAPTLLKTIGTTCRPGSQIATFTSAGRVRRALTEVGFEMRRVDQRPHKRESLAGTYRSTSEKQKTSLKSLTIHGAGIAGAMVARHAAEAGVASSVVDPDGIANGGSKMHNTLLHARLLGDQTTSAALRSHAFHYATAYMHNWGNRASGALQVQSPNLDARKLERVASAYGAHDPAHRHWIEYRDDSPAELGLAEGEAYLWFPTSRVIDLHDLCHKLLDHPLISIRSDIPDRVETEVICTGTASRNFEGLDWLELADITGQVDRVTFDDHANKANVPIVGAGYYLPLEQGAAIGSTYEYQPWTEAQATAQNIEKNRRYLPANAASESLQRAVRSVTSDRIPLVGHIDNQRYLCTGFGSMGTTYAPLAASTIVSTLLGEMPPLTTELNTAWAPQRIAERQARRGVRHR